MSNLNEAIIKTLKYSPYVYQQATNISNKTGEFMIRFPYKELPPNSLLYFLPTANSVQCDAKTKNKLRIKFVYTDENGETKYGNDKYYTILVEQTNGHTKFASDGHIVAGRLCIFRVPAVDDDTIVLINSPIYNEVALSSLVVTNEATFYEPPKVLKEKEQEGDPDEYVELISEDQFEALRARVEALEQKFQVGTIDAETALSGRPDGTFYVKVDKT